MRKNEISENTSQKKYKYVILILTLLVVISVAANGWLVFYYTRQKNSDASSLENKFNLLNPARNFFKQEDLIINFQPLRDYLNDKYETDQNISVYFEYLPTGVNIALNKDAEFYPASLLKVPVAIAVVKKIERGDWRWTNELVLMSTDKDDEFGSLYKEKTNSTHTIEDLVRRSLSDSDNTAHFILVRNLETSEVGDIYDHIGLIGFLKTDGKLSAKRYSAMFRSLYNASYVSEDNSQKLLSYLSQSEFKEFIESALPQDVVFSHKIGIAREQKVFLDSGVVYLKNRPYILTVMIRDTTKQKAKEIMEDISEKVYNYVKDYSEKND